ncbi:NAD(P)/FAD-dependent oxidoreductase [Paenibacillus sp. FSL K6-1230]|uniref:NAD(P)/FAD-dependent oxidoreductase n=1 Tax=Paenibacillus sp. FSL K6-1230 TaxID=2921603 RepID=UPI0030FADA84
MKKIIVIGAGILGASTAYQLAKSGAEVLIVDRKDPGQATDAAAGILCPWISQRRNQAWYKLAKEGARFYPQLIAELTHEGETDTGYAQVGALSIHYDEDKLAKLEERAQQRKADAAEMGEISRLSQSETRDAFPLLAEEYHSVLISGAARVDGRALRDALLRSAERYGARLVQGSAELQYQGDCVTGVVVRDVTEHANDPGNSGEEETVMTYAADEVVVCAGAWASQLLEPLGLDFQVHYQKAQILHLQTTNAGDTGSWPVVIPPSDQYLLTFDQQRVVMGATHENDIEGYDTSVTAGGMQEVLNKGLAVAPGLADSTLLEVRVGFRPFTPGFLPVLGAVPGWKGLFAANGLGASGLTVGPYVGSQLAKLVLGMEADIDLEHYDLQQAINKRQ